MAAVKNKNTAAEILVRRAFHKKGYRFRLHVKDLPGSPDLVLPKFRLCVFVHGCFWHQHESCKRATVPQANRDFWVSKFAKNAARDREVQRALRELNWTVSVIWSCEVSSAERLSQLVDEAIDFAVSSSHS